MSVEWKDYFVSLRPFTNTFEIIYDHVKRFDHLQHPLEDVGDGGSGVSLDEIVKVVRCFMETKWDPPVVELWRGTDLEDSCGNARKMVFRIDCSGDSWMGFLDR